MNAFCSFEELGFEDYIFNLKWKIKGKTFPLEKHTFGDLSEKDPIFHHLCYPVKKQYKNFVLNNFSIAKEEITTEKFEEKNKLDIEKIVQTAVEKHTKNLIKEEKNETILIENNNYLKEEEIINTNTKNIHNKTENKEYNVDNNINTIIQNQINQSSNYTVQVLNKLENSINTISNSSNNTQKTIKEFKKNIDQETKLLKENMEKEIKNNKNYLIKFLNS